MGKWEPKIHIPDELLEENERWNKLEQELADVKAENEIFRRLLWMAHGSHGQYGDDGELQCAECRLDFKRDNATKIEHVLKSGIIG